MKARADNCDTQHQRFSFVRGKRTPTLDDEMVTSTHILSCLSLLIPLTCGLHVTRGGHLFYANTYKLVPQLEAVKHCHVLGGHVPEFNATDTLFMVDLLRRLNTVTPYDLWLDARNFSGGYRYTQSQHLVPSNLWGPGPPQCIGSCGLVLSQIGGRLHLRPIAHLYHPICVFDLWNGTQVSRLLNHISLVENADESMQVRQILLHQHPTIEKKELEQKIEHDVPQDVSASGQKLTDEPRVPEVSVKPLQDQCNKSHHHNSEEDAKVQQEIGRLRHELRELESRVNKSRNSGQPAARHLGPNITQLTNEMHRLEAQMHHINLNDNNRIRNAEQEIGQMRQEVRGLESKFKGKNSAAATHVEVLLFPILYFVHLSH